MAPEAMRPLVGTPWVTLVAAQAPADCTDEVRVAEVSGLLDPVLVDFVESTTPARLADGLV